MEKELLMRMLDEFVVVRDDGSSVHPAICDWANQAIRSLEIENKILKEELQMLKETADVPKEPKQKYVLNVEILTGRNILCHYDHPKMTAVDGGSLRTLVVSWEDGEKAVREAQEILSAMKSKTMSADWSVQYELNYLFDGAILDIKTLGTRGTSRRISNNQCSLMVEFHLMDMQEQPIYTQATPCQCPYRHPRPADCPSG